MDNRNIRPMTAQDRGEVLHMMRTFYDSPAVLHTSGNAVLERDFADCVGDCPFIRGFILEMNGETAGYAMTAVSYTTEYGGICVWLEDLYIRPEFQHKGLAGDFFCFLERQFPHAVRFKLEVEPENAAAVSCYRKNGYDISHYFLMTKEKVKDE